MSEALKPFVIALTGPTATGKTAFAVRLAQELGGEIVSCDSMQIYRHMRIGTAVPGEAERQGIPHQMMECLPPQESYSVADYCRDAARCIDDIAARGRQPIVAGGTGLYLDSLLGGLSYSEMPAAQELRQQLRREADERGGEALLERLRALDAETAARLHKNDHKRIIRALEVVHSTGRPLSQLGQEARGEPRYRTLWLGLDYSDRALLYSRIERRVELMMEQGLLDEVRALLALPGIDRGTALQAIGIKELAQALAQDGDVDQAVEDIKRATRRYAKRQQTWFKRNADIHWFYRDQLEDEAILAQMLQLARTEQAKN